ncbi:MAG: response regulator transcription factor [Chloroflexi bacterium]|nr:response regulator transcription factor [Chloroflexota bacterium]
MPNTSPIRILIADDHAMIRRGLAAYLLGRADLTVVGQAADGQEALDAIPALRPDVVLLDIQMPRLNGIEAARRIRQGYPDVRVIMLTSFQESDLMQAALAAGASGYLLKDVAEEDLVAAIRLAHAGHTLVPPGLAAPGSRPVASAPAAPSPDDDDLSGREREILALLAAGLTNKEIAHRAALSLSTVKFHISNIIAKLGVSSRTEAVSVALKRRLVK